MNTLTFKTNINCGNCVRAVTPVLNEEAAIETWQVDTASPEKLLTVTGTATREQVVALIEEAGFEARPA